MPAHNAHKHLAINSAFERGLTLVELMVALAVGLLVAIATLSTQLALTSQNIRTVDKQQNNNEARAALDIITQDLSSAGFLAGGKQSPCDLRLNYNSGAAGSGYFASYTVSAPTVLSGGSLKFSAATSLIFNYPTGASGIVSNALILTAFPNATQYTDSASPIRGAAQNVTLNTIITGQLPVTTLPPAIAAGDKGITQVSTLDPAGNKRVICMRVPVSGTGSSSGTPYVNSSGTQMPPGSYGGFSAQLANYGMPVGTTFNNGQLQTSTTKFIDLGPSSIEQTLIYYIDNSAAVPVLTRAIVNTENDTFVGTPQAIAAGVVSIQALFGVDTLGLDAVDTYMTWANVLANKQITNVRTVQLALISRTLYPDNKYTAPASIVIPSPGFTAFPTAANPNNHYSVLLSEIAIRSQIWKK